MLSDGLAGTGRICCVSFSQTGKSVYYRGKRLATFAGKGYKANFFDVTTGERYWVSGPKKRGDDSLYFNTIEIDEDVRGEYWLKIRHQPEPVHLTQFRSEGKYAKRKPRLYDGRFAEERVSSIAF